MCGMVAHTLLVSSETLLSPRETFVRTVKTENRHKHVQICHIKCKLNSRLLFNKGPTQRDLFVVTNGHKMLKLYN